MRLNNNLIDRTIRVLTEILRGDGPADGVMSRFFREHRDMGHNDRGFVAETVYTILRRQREVEALTEPDFSARRMVLTALVRFRGANLRELESFIRQDEKDWLAGVRGADLTAQPEAVRFNLPDWLYQRLHAVYGDERLAALVDALQRPAPLDLRVNTLKAERDGVLARLAEAGLDAKAGAWSPVAIRLEGKPSLSRLDLFTSGAIEVQDEGSQLLAYLLAPKRGEMVVDFCAGAGGKTLQIGAMMRSQGRLYAFDVSEKRLAKFKPRMARSGLSNVHPQRINDEKDGRLKRLAGKMDRVLVDAPCSGLGTLRRNPDLKWRQSAESVAELVELQKSILNAASKLVRPGGRLVYATCSLLPEENDGVVDVFLSEHPEFSIVPASAILEKQGVVLAGAGDRLYVDPVAHHCDGFFAAALERRQPIG